MEIITKVSTPTGTQYQCFLSENELEIIIFGGEPYENKDIEKEARELFDKLNKGYTNFTIQLFKNLGGLIRFVRYKDFKNYCRNLQSQINRLSEIGNDLENVVVQTLEFGSPSSVDKEI